MSDMRAIDEAHSSTFPNPASDFPASAQDQSHAYSIRSSRHLHECDPATNPCSIGAAEATKYSEDYGIDQDSAYGSYNSPVQDQHEKTKQRLLNEDSDRCLNGSYDDQSTVRSSSTDGYRPPIEQDETVRESRGNHSDSGPVSWRSLPRKSQLLVLTLTRLAEPLVQTSLSSYMFFMLQSFDPSLPDAKISTQAGILSGSFTGAQCLTAVWWGKIADKPSVGRKNVLIVGIMGTLMSSLGFGFSKSFAAATFWRSLGGALNGNVGVMRTMISEIVKEKKYQPKAFLVMPVTFNVGVLIGPLLGGWLQNPVDTFPSLIGPGSSLGGSNGVAWMRQFPYALPNIVNAAFLSASALLLVFALEETHVERQGRPDYGLMMGRAVSRFWSRLIICNWRSTRHNYHRLAVEEDFEREVHSLQPLQGRERTRTHNDDQVSSVDLSSVKSSRPHSRLFTRNIIFTLMTHGLLAGHLGAFSNLWFIFLSTPRPRKREIALPFHFSSGLGLDPPTIGFAVGILGAIGLLLQFGIYSRVTHRLGIVRAYRWSLALFPVVYALAPYLAVLPFPDDNRDGSTEGTASSLQLGKRATSDASNSSSAPSAHPTPLIWTAISFLLFLQVLARTFSIPLTQILVNDCAPDSSVLGTVHGIGQSVSAGARTVGPVVAASVYGVGLEKGVVGLAWWGLAMEAAVAWAVSWGVVDGGV